ncbi:transposase [Mycobacterium sp. KBS0706]|nr:transposase [Mycobacterium sp. KBS0706]
MDVGSLRRRRQIADRHVLDHATAQRAQLGHRSLLSGDGAAHNPHHPSQVASSVTASSRASGFVQSHRVNLQGPWYEIALDQIRAVRAADVPEGVVLMDAGYGADTRLRTEITVLGLTYVAVIQPHTSVWAPGTGPLPPKPWSGRGRPTSRTRRDAEHRPIQAKALALDLPASAWETITWREGSADWLTSRYARIRVRTGHRDEKLQAPRAEEWLLVEWPEDEAEPTKYWLSTLPADIPFAELVDLTKLRWRIERDYQDLKQELGLGHYEGRGWLASIITPRSASPPTAS